jgi:predicted DNA-binding WGR domain protein
MRRFEFIAGNSAKFWEVSCLNSAVTVRFGRLGTDGQSQTKELESPDRARQHADKLIAQKLAKGYVECVTV